jgi:hypothetical protein
MQYHNIKFRFFLIGLFMNVYFLQINAQRSLVVAGGEMFSNTASASYSIGQIFYEYGQRGSASIIQGNQQPYEWYVVNTEDPVALNGLNIHFFPNPTLDFLHLEITEHVPGEVYDFFLFNVSGQAIIKQKITESKTLISLENMLEGVYFMQITSDRKPYLNNNFKIIKN